MIFVISHKENNSQNQKDYLDRGHTENIYLGKNNLDNLEHKWGYI